MRHLLYCALFFFLMTLPVVTKIVPNNRHVGTEIDKGITQNIVPIPTPMIRGIPEITNKNTVISIVILPLPFYKSLRSYNFVQTNIDNDNTQIVPINKKPLLKLTCLILTLKNTSRINIGAIKRKRVIINVS